MRPRVALATYERAPGLAPDDRSLLPALEARGIDAEPAVWSNDGVAWESFDAVIIRSCWDYHLRIADFRSWLARVESAAGRVWNSPSLIRWNADKRYLLDLGRRGVATIPSMIVPRGRSSELEQLLAARGSAWHRFVIKPAISASGYETYALRVPLDDASRASVARVAAIGDALVQPFAEEVPRDGEYSFTFIDGAFSHATIKRVGGGHGEFRVQTEHGGTADRVDVADELVAQAAHVLAVLPETPLYARVDGIVRGSAFLLMELELIEPNLFLELRAGAADLMAQAIAKRLSS